METSWLLHLIEWLALIFIFAIGTVALMRYFYLTLDYGPRSIVSIRPMK